MGESQSSALRSQNLEEALAFVSFASSALRTFPHLAKRSAMLRLPRGRRQRRCRQSPGDVIGLGSLRSLLEAVSGLKLQDGGTRSSDFKIALS